jgi:hypothetical protein
MPVLGWSGHRIGYFINFYHLSFLAFQVYKSGEGRGVTGCLVFLQVDHHLSSGEVMPPIGYLPLLKLGNWAEWVVVAPEPG